MSFATADKDSESNQSGSKKITTQTLCEITGQKYYAHNDEIPLPDHKEVRVYDENEQLIGDLKFSDALSAARAV